MNSRDNIEPLQSPANASAKPLASSPPPSFSESTAGTSETLQHYKDRATALLQVSTFAATITFTIILTPRDNGQTTPGLVQLAYANALFCGAIIGSIFVIIGIEIANAQPAITKSTLNTKSTMNRSWVMKLAQAMALLVVEDMKTLLGLVHIVAGFVGLSLFAAFYIMIYATRQFLQYDGPFILGTVIYAVLGFLAISIWVFSSFLEQEEYQYLVKGLELDDSRGGSQEISGNTKVEV
jgi:hypothetical protein